MDDEKLLQLLQQDPDAGMECLMDRYAGLLYAVVRDKLSACGCVSSDIEDCVADVFSEFYIGMDRYDPALSSIKSYLCVMARNHAKDILRKRARQNRHLCQEDAQAVSEIADAYCVESDLMERELRKEVLDAIKNLGEPDASILIGKYYFGISSKELARSLRLSVGNVDTRAHRALQKLKKQFGGEV